MKASQFELLAHLLRSQGKARLAAKAVLVEGMSQADAMRTIGTSRSGVSNTVAKFLQAEKLIRQEFCGRCSPQPKETNNE